MRNCFNVLLFLFLLNYVNGSKPYYRGDWLNGRYHGKGEYVDRSGGQYVGEFQNGRRHGYGIQEYSNGAKFEGQYVKGKKYYGSYFYANGGKYTGGWENGKRDGEGVFINEYGVKENQHWVDGILIEENQKNNTSDYTIIKELPDSNKINLSTSIGTSTSNVFKEIIPDSINDKKTKLEKIITKDTTNANAFFELGTIHYEFKDTSNAIKNISLAAKLGLDEAYLWFEKNDFKWETFEGTFINKRIGKYINGKKEGNWTYWNEWEELEMEENYINGKLDGIKTIMYLGGGSVFLEETYKDGIRNGLRIEYYRSEKKKQSEAEWVNNKLNGYRKSWYENGQLKEDELFLDGNLNGLRKIFYENGQKRLEENYILGKNIGTSTGYDESGEVKYTTEYKDGEVIFDSRWNDLKEPS